MRNADTIELLKAMLAKTKDQKLKKQVESKIKELESSDDPEEGDKNKASPDQKKRMGGTIDVIAKFFIQTASRITAESILDAFKDGHIGD